MSWVVVERRASPCATVPFGLHGLSLLSRACSETPSARGLSFSRAIASDCSRGNTGRKRERKRRGNGERLRVSYLVRQPPQSSNPRFQRTMRFCSSSLPTRRAWRDDGDCRGPNRSGKSTTVKMLASLLEPTHGEVLYGAGVPEEPNLYPYLSVPRVGVVAAPRCCRGTLQHVSPQSVYLYPALCQHTASAVPQDD
jgi:hypothetical protein